jgi:hypothetical protein
VGKFRSPFAPAQQHHAIAGHLTIADFGGSCVRAIVDGVLTDPEAVRY